MSRYFAWNPWVFHTFRDEMAFFQIATTSANRTTFVDDLAQFLCKEGIEAFRIYRVFGSYDLILRAWIPVGGKNQLMENMRRMLAYIRSIEGFVVHKITHHWHWGSTANKSGPHSAEDSALIIPSGKFGVQYLELLQTLLKGGENEPFDPNSTIDNALRQNVIRKVFSCEEILFFTFIDISHARITDKAKSVLASVNELLKRHANIIQKQAVYLIDGSNTGLLVKGESKGLFDIGVFVTDVYERLADLEIKTETAVVLSPEIRGSEQLSSRMFKQIQSTDLLANRVFPEIYEVPERTYVDTVVAWINHNHEFHPQDLAEVVQESLSALVRDHFKGKSNQFSRCMFGHFMDAEQILRPLTPRFAFKHARNDTKTVYEFLRSSLEPDAWQRVEGDIAKKVKIGDTLDFLTLGSRLNFFTHITKELSLSKKPSILDSWSDISRLRNKLGHGHFTYSADKVGDALSDLTLLLRFRRRLVDVLDLLQSTV